MTIKVRSDYTDGGSGLGSGETALHPRMASVLRGLVDDLAGLRGAVIASPDATDLATAQTLVNEIKAALNARSETPAAAVLLGTNTATFDFTGALDLIVKVDGVDRAFAFVAGDFAAIAAATIAEVVGALNSRGALAEAGVLAQDNGGACELVGGLGGAKSLQGVASTALTILGLPTTAVAGTGFAPSVVKA